MELLHLALRIADIAGNIVSVVVLIALALVIVAIKRGLGGK